MRRPTRRVKTLAIVLGIAMVAVLSAYAAVITIPPDKYPPGCHPDGKALQEGDANYTLIGTHLRDLLRAGPGDDYIGGEGKPTVSTASRASTG